MLTNPKIEELDTKIQDLKIQRSIEYTNLVKAKLLTEGVKQNIVDSITDVTYKHKEFSIGDNYQIHATISFDTGFYMEYLYDRHKRDFTVTINDRQKCEDIDKFYEAYGIGYNVDENGEYLDRQSYCLSTILEIISDDEYANFDRFM